MRELRRRMFSSDTLPEHCRACLGHGASSPARYSASFDLSAYDHSSGLVRIAPMDIYLFTGRQCALACQMCDSLHSVTHEKLFPGRAKDNFDERFLDPRSLVTREAGRKYIIYGGEPYQYSHIDELLRMTIPDSRETAILTNGMHSVTRPSTRDLIDRHSSKVVFVFSLDGPPVVNEKVRVNGRTDRVVRHLREARARGWTCDIHYTISTLNVAKFTEFIEWLREIGLLEDPELRLNVAPVIDPLDFNPSSLPERQKTAAVDEIDRLWRLLDEWKLSDPWRARIEIANRGVRDSLYSR